MKPDAALVRNLGALAQARKGNALARTLMCAACAVCATAILGNLLPFYWFLLSVLVLHVDYRVHTWLAKRCDVGQPPAKMWGLMAWTATQSAVIGLIAIPLWHAKYLHGEALAIVYMLGGLGNAAATLRSAPKLALSGAGATLCFLFGLPLADYILNGRNALDLIPLVGGLLYVGFGFSLWRHLVDADRAQLEAQAALQRERQAALAAARAKSDAIRRMSDELRTPMAALSGAAEHLRRAAVSQEARVHIGAIVHAGDVLRLALEDLSDLERLDNGEVRIAAKPCDPRELARSVVGAFRAAAEDKGLELFLDIAPETPALVEIDPLRVRQIMFNLVANAVRYTSHGGVRVRLQVQAADTHDRIRLGFVVADTGAGMSRSQLAMVFSRERVAPAGAGLGLSISLRMAKLMGGKLAGKSELGQGSVFSFVIEAPVLRAAQRGGRSAA